MGLQIDHPAEHQTLLFNDSGTYTFRVEQIPGRMLAGNVGDTRRQVAALAVCIQTVGRADCE